MFDGTTNVTIDDASATLVGVIAGDTVTLAGSPVGSIASPDVDVNLPVTVSGFTLAGADAGNYTLAQPTGVTVNITPADFVFTYPGATAGRMSTLDEAIADAATDPTAQGVAGQILNGTLEWFTDAGLTTPAGANPFTEIGPITLWWQFTPIPGGTGNPDNYVANMSGLVNFTVADGDPRTIKFPKCNSRSGHGGIRFRADYACGDFIG